MYHYNFKIIVLSKSPSLFERIAAEPSLKGFTNQVFHLERPDASLENADLLICESDVMSLLEAVSLLSEKAVKLFLGTDEELAKLPDSILSQLDDFWQLPLSSRSLDMKIHKLFARIKEQKDYHLTENYLNTLINTIPPLIWFKDIRGAHLKVNDSFCTAVGKQKSDVEGRGHYYIWDLKPEEYAAGEYVCLETEQQVLNEKRTLLFDEIVKTRKGLRQFKTYKSPIWDDNNDLIGTVGCAIDVTDEKNLLQKLVEAAETDTLTHLFNRRHFYRYISEAMTDHKHINIFYMDLDNFKRVNDTHGHEVGDELLWRVARLLETVFSGGACVRYGGDEFVCVLEGDYTRQELAGYAERFLAELKVLVDSTQKFAGVSASIGIASSDNMDDVDGLLRKSDEAMYTAKHCGKASYKFTK